MFVLRLARMHNFKAQSYARGQSHNFPDAFVMTRVYFLTAASVLRFQRLKQPQAPHYATLPTFLL
jgi:hypothetical protein